MKSNGSTRSATASSKATSSAGGALTKSSGLMLGGAILVCMRVSYFQRVLPTPSP